MELVNDCYISVKKNCFKYIKSQETNTNKFKNKDRMLKSYLIPLCFWIVKKTNKKKPLIIGLIAFILSLSSLHLLIINFVRYVFPTLVPVLVMK